jgi:hypothetical protein
MVTMRINQITINIIVVHPPLTSSYVSFINHGCFTLAYNYLFIINHPSTLFRMDCRALLLTWRMLFRAAVRLLPCFWSWLCSIIIVSFSPFCGLHCCTGEFAIVLYRIESSSDILFMLQMPSSTQNDNGCWLCVWSLDRAAPLRCKAVRS